MTEEKKKTTILFAEDETDVRKLVSRTLVKYGFDVIEANNGQEAIDIYKTEKKPIHAIVSDLKMPVVDGIRFAEFNYKNRFLPFIVCTAVTDGSIALELLKYGVQDFITKPIGNQDFIGAIRNAIDRRLVEISDSPDLGKYSGNVGAISIPTKLEELLAARRWLRSQIKSAIKADDLEHFLNYFDEFLLNAYEHGNLGIGEAKKGKLIQEGLFNSELKMREAKCSDMISIGVSVLEDEIAVNISDCGTGFDYEKYLNMNEDTLVQRLEMVNGRGITMAQHYFDSIKYTKRGASVFIRKRIISNPEKIEPALI